VAAVTRSETDSSCCYFRWLSHSSPLHRHAPSSPANRVRLFGAACLIAAVVVGKVAVVAFFPAPKIPITTTTVVRDSSEGERAWAR